MNGAGNGRVLLVGIEALMLRSPKIVVSDACILPKNIFDVVEALCLSTMLRKLTKIECHARASLSLARIQVGDACRSVGLGGAADERDSECSNVIAVGPSVEAESSSS